MQHSLSHTVMMSAKRKTCLSVNLEKAHAISKRLSQHVHELPESNFFLLAFIPRY